jgi:hypothetical protein
MKLNRRLGICSERQLTVWDCLQSEAGRCQLKPRSIGSKRLYAIRKPPPQLSLISRHNFANLLGYGEKWRRTQKHWAKEKVKRSLVRLFQ